jgi:hypothetical protein
VLVGCLGLFVIGGIMLAAGAFFVAKKAKSFVEEVAENPIKKSVELVVRLNPDLDLVSSDDQAQTMTLRNNKTGEVATFDWSDIQNGNFKFGANGEEYSVDGSGIADGRVTMKDQSGKEVMSFGAGAGELPSWFPQYPDASEVNVLVNANQNGQESKIWTFKSAAPVAEVMSFYEERLKADDWIVESSQGDAGGTANGSLEAKKSPGRTISIVVSKSPGEPAQAMVSYTGTGG